jgi:autotransporter-associated beta strand protein
MLLAAVVLLMQTLCGRANAVTLYWDKDLNAANNNTTTGAGLGGTGTVSWDVANSWYNGSSDVSWIDASDAVFWGPSAGTITQTAVHNVNSLSFKTTGYIIAGTNSSSSTPALNLAGSSVTVDTGVAASILATVTGSAGLVKNGPGALHLLSSNPYTGGTTINAGTLGIASGALGALPGAPTVNITINNGATLRFNTDGQILNVNRQMLLGTGGGVLNTNGFNAGVASVISGSSLSKAGAGTLTLTNANTYTGGTTVSAGTLLVSNTTGSGTGTGAVTVSAGATLGGTGTIAGTVTNGGFVAPGAGTAGTLNVGGDYIQSASGAFNVELDFAPGLAHDFLNVTGNATLAGALNVSLLSASTPHIGDTFQILHAAGLAGSQFTTTNLPTLAPGLGWNVNYGATSVTLSVGSAALPGDFTADGVVDAADYVVWRKGLGTTYTQADYTAWSAHFGQSAAASGAAAAVPEPSVAVLAAFCLLLPSCCRRARARMSVGEKA